MTQCNVIDFGVKRTMREMTDLRLMNFAWYFENYDGDLEDDMKQNLERECHMELNRRGLEYAD